jgi:hypothetical protein
MREAIERLGGPGGGLGGVSLDRSEAPPANLSSNAPKWRGPARRSRSSAPPRAAADARPDLGSRREQRAAARVEQRAPKRPQPRRNGYVDRLAQHWQRHQRWLEAARKKVQARRGLAAEPLPPYALISPELWRDCMDIAWDPTGKAAKIHLARLRRPAWAAIIRKAALGELASGECMRGWSSERARGIAIDGLILCRLQQRGRRRGKWIGLVRGVTRGAFAAAASGARDRRLHRNTISGRHRMGAAAESGHIGYLDALEAYGLIYRQRLPAHQVATWERWTGRDGKTYAANRYWVINPDPFDGHLPPAGAVTRAGGVEAWTRAALRADVRAALLELHRAAMRSDEIRLVPLRAPRVIDVAPCPALEAPD